MVNSLPIRKTTPEPSASNDRKQQADEFFDDDTPAKKTISQSGQAAPKLSPPISRPSVLASRIAAGQADPISDEEKEIVRGFREDFEDKYGRSAVEPQKPLEVEEQPVRRIPPAGLRGKPLTPPKKRLPMPPSSDEEKFDPTPMEGATPHHAVKFDEDDEVQLPESSSESNQPSAPKKGFKLKPPAFPKKSSESPDTKTSALNPKKLVTKKTKGTKIEWVNGEPIQVVTAEEEEELNSGVESQLTPQSSGPSTLDNIKYYGRKGLAWFQIPVMVLLVGYYITSVMSNPSIILSHISLMEVETVFGIGPVYEDVINSQNMTASVHPIYMMTGIAAVIALMLGWNARRCGNPVFFLFLPLLAASMASGFFLISLLSPPFYPVLSVLAGSILLLGALYLQPTTKIKK